MPLAGAKAARRR